MYTGQIQRRIEDVDVDEPAFDIKFMQHEKPWSFSFIFRNVENVPHVVSINAVMKLPSPTQYSGTARVARHICFPVDLTTYSSMLR